MPETKKQARARAKKLHFPLGNVIKAKKGGWYIAPRGETPKQMQAYADMRSTGMSAKKAAKISHSIK